MEHEKGPEAAEMSALGPLLCVMVILNKLFDFGRIKAPKVCLDCLKYSGIMQISNFLVYREPRAVYFFVEF